MWAAARLKAIEMENVPSTGLFCQSPPISASSCGCFSILMGIYGSYMLVGPGELFHHYCKARILDRPGFLCVFFQGGRFMF